MEEVRIRNVGENDIWVHCTNPLCAHSHRFLWEELLVAHGENITAQELKRRFRCRKCGHRGSQITLSFTGCTGLSDLTARIMEENEKSEN